MTGQFWDRIAKGNPTDCWPWTGRIDQDGYGQFTKRSLRAHRVVYEWSVGPIPAGMTIDHICHTTACAGGRDCLHRRCCNPAHMEVVSASTNVMRGKSQAAENARKTHCKHGHPFNLENTRIEQRGGKFHRVCRKCHAEVVARSRARSAA